MAHVREGDRETHSRQESKRVKDRENTIRTTWVKAEEKKKLMLLIMMMMEHLTIVC